MTMTKPDDLTAMWILGELWGAPPDVSGALSDEENLDYGRALLCAANGDGRITDAERDWIVGYLRAAGHSPENIASLQAYEGTTDIEDLFMRGVQPGAKRITIADAIRACGADGDLADEELAAVCAIAERIDVPAEVVDELIDIYRQEQELKSRRIALVFPDGITAAAESARAG
jgi:uncharacterized membrane protein YebE (DUF533 family)